MGLLRKSFNWLENQYDIVLSSGSRTGAKADAVKTNPGGFLNGLKVDVTGAGKGSGDNTIVYLNYGISASFNTGALYRLPRIVLK